MALFPLFVASFCSAGGEFDFSGGQILPRNDRLKNLFHAIILIFMHCLVCLKKSDSTVQYTVTFNSACNRGYIIDV